jgi:hypothetical protein
MANENDRRLKRVGPIDPNHGFPLWFEDENGLRLELGLNPNPRNPDPLIPAIGDLKPATKLPATNPPDRFPFPDTLPEEIFYFLAEAQPNVGAGARARVILALEAAFGGDGDPHEGLNVVFARIRVRMDGLPNGAKYRVTHPYGVFEDLEADDRGRVFYTKDLGIVEGDPTAVLRSGQVAPFLQWSSGAPKGYIGDGVTDRQITGSPPNQNSNFVKIEQMEGTTAVNTWQTDLFAVQGKLATRVGAWLDRATYAKTSTGDFLLNIQARSDAGKALNNAEQDLRLVASGVNIKLVREGEFYTGLTQVPRLPTDAELVNNSDSPPTRYPVEFVDRVIVESAIHDRLTNILEVKARSSDPTATLTISNLNQSLTTNPQQFTRMAVPAEIVIKSDRGGEGRQWVEVTGNPDANQPVEVKIAPVPDPVLNAIKAFTKEPVELDGSGSLGATAFAWTQTAGPTITPPPTNTTSAKFTFTPDQVGLYTFKLTVQGEGGFKDTSVSVDVTDPGPDNLNVDLCQYRTSKEEFRITGTVDRTHVPNEILVKYNGTEVGRSMADIDGNWSVKKTRLEAGINTDPQSDANKEVIVTSKRGDTKQPTLFIRP